MVLCLAFDGVRRGGENCVGCEEEGPKVVDGDLSSLWIVMRLLFLFSAAVMVVESREGNSMGLILETRSPFPLIYSRSIPSFSVLSQPFYEGMRSEARGLRCHKRQIEIYKTLFR